ncbi:UdgX family uracil-DNA binding protein [Parafrigoribacterium mesophilum]|uniref:UdgX family uracil-DNA binding protein n=1 Tax=Parafrigoribacterium mesophilum TaxID=433646 RepID=UPI0031FD2D16
MVDVQRPGAQRWLPERVPAGGTGIEELHKAAQRCRGCELWRDATQLVFSAGVASAPLMLVGEQPGDREDRVGEPFVGPAGRVLADALEAADIAQADVYLTNAVKHFHFVERGKRRIHATPEVGHIAACHPWLEAELAAVAPDVIVCLGATAGRSVLGRPVRIGAERGTVLHETALNQIAPNIGGVLVTAHPSAVLRLRGRDGWDEAFDQLVHDLAVARAAAGER